MNKKLLIGIVLGIILIYFSVRGIHFDQTLSYLKTIYVPYAALALLLIVFMQVLRSYRWGVILEPMEKIGQSTLFAVTSIGYLAILAIPARVGELARPFLIAQKSSVRMPSALGTIVVERVLDGLAVLSITMIVAAFFVQQVPPWIIKSSIIFSMTTFVIIAGIIGMIWRRERALKVMDRIVRWLPDKLAVKINNVIHHFIDGFQVITDFKRLLYVLFLSIVIWVVDVASVYALFLAFGFNLSVLAAFVLMVILIIGVAIPTAPGFIGTWHYACIISLELFGIAKPEAFAFAVVYHFLTILILITLGVIFLPFYRFSFSSITKLTNSVGKS